MNERTRTDGERASPAAVRPNLGGTAESMVAHAGDNLRSLQTMVGNAGAAQLLTAAGVPSTLQRRINDGWSTAFSIPDPLELRERAVRKGDAARARTEDYLSSRPALKKTPAKKAAAAKKTPAKKTAAAKTTPPKKTKQPSMRSHSTASASARGAGAAAGAAAAHGVGAATGRSPSRRATAAASAGAAGAARGVGAATAGAHRGPSDADLFPQGVGGAAGGARGARGGAGAGRRGGARGGARGAAAATTAATAAQAGAAATAAQTAAPGAGGGDRALISQELAEHQSWGQSVARVGQAESADRAAWVAEQVGRGEASGFVQGGAMGFAMGAAGGLLKFAGRYAGPFGAIMGGAVSLYTMASRQYWREAWTNISSFGQGSDTYERLANSIAAISSIIDIANNVLQVVGGICGILTLACWAATALSLGALSPLAVTLTSVTTAIGVVSMLLMALKSVVLDPLVILFRSLHAYKDRADPRDVARQGEQLQSAGAAVGGALGGFIGAKAGEGTTALGGRGVAAARARSQGAARSNATATEAAAARGGRGRGAVEAEPPGGARSATAADVPRPAETAPTRTDRLAGWIRENAPGLHEGMNRRFGAQGSAQPFLNQHFGPGSRLGRFGSWGERWAARLAWPWERPAAGAHADADRPSTAAAHEEPHATVRPQEEGAPTGRGHGADEVTQVRPAPTEETTQVRPAPTEDTAAHVAPVDDPTLITAAPADPAAATPAAATAAPARGGALPLSADPHSTMARVQGTQIGEPVTVHTNITEAGTNGSPAYGIEGRFTARRVQLASGETVAEITIKVHLENGPVCTPQDIADADAAIRAGVQDRINGANHSLPNGDRVHVRVEVVAGPAPDASSITVHTAPPAAASTRYRVDPDGTFPRDASGNFIPDPAGRSLLHDASGNVIVDRWGSPTERHSNAGHYFMEDFHDEHGRLTPAGRTTAAHEQGHSGLGLIDEYRDRGAADRHRRDARGVSTPAENSLMGNYHVEGVESARLQTRHLQQIQDAITQAQSGVPGTITRVWAQPTGRRFSPTVANDQITVTPLNTAPAGPSAVTGSGPGATVSGGAGTTATAGSTATGGHTVTGATTTPVSGGTTTTVVDAAPVSSTANDATVVTGTPASEVTPVTGTPAATRATETTQIVPNPVSDTEVTQVRGRPTGAADETTQITRNPFADDEVTQVNARPTGAADETTQITRNPFADDEVTQVNARPTGAADETTQITRNPFADDEVTQVNARPTGAAEETTQITRNPFADDEVTQVNARPTGAAEETTQITRNPFADDEVTQVNARPTGAAEETTQITRNPFADDEVTQVVRNPLLGPAATGPSSAASTTVTGAPGDGRPAGLSTPSSDTVQVPVVIDDGRTIIAEVRPGGRGGAGDRDASGAGAFDPERTFIGPNPLLAGRRGPAAPAGAPGGGGAMPAVRANRMPADTSGAAPGATPGISPEQAGAAVVHLASSGVQAAHGLVRTPAPTPPRGTGAMAAAAGAAAAVRQVSEPLGGDSGRSDAGGGQGIPPAVGRQLTAQALEEAERGGGGAPAGGGDPGAAQPAASQVTPDGRVTERPNPQYRNPPGSLEQVDALQAEIAVLREAQQTAQGNSRRLGTESARAAAQQAQVTEANAAATEAGGHVDQHATQVNERQAATQEQRGMLDQAGERAADYAGRSAGTATLKGLLRGFSGFLSLFEIQVPIVGGYILPQGVRRGARSMKADSDGFLANLAEADRAMAAQPANVAAGHQEVGANEATLTAVSAQGQGTRAQVTQVQQDGQALATAVATRQTEAQTTRTAEEQHAGRAGSQLARKQQQHDQLLASLRAWAEEHRAAREVAVGQSRARLTEAGMQVTRADPHAQALV